MSNLLQANKTSVENEARGIANSVNRVIQGKFPPELMDKYLECLSCQLDYSIAVSKKACKSTETIMNKYKLSVNGNVMVADVFSSYFASVGDMQLYSFFVFVNIFFLFEANLFEV